MTHKILKSSLALFTFTPEERRRGIVDFQSAVASYAAELVHWRDREAKIAAQPPLPSKPQLGDFITSEEYAAAFHDWQTKANEHFHPVPKPAAHPDIVAAVNDDGHVDFEVVNDDPTEEEVLRGKKNELLNRIHVAEQAAIEKALPPPGKRRLANLRETEIQQADDATRRSLVAGMVAVKKSALDTADIERIEKTVAERRHPDHAQHLAAQESRRAEVDAIVRVAAQAMSDVEDLTADNIDTFEIPSFGNLPDVGEA